MALVWGDAACYNGHRVGDDFSAIVTLRRTLSRFGLATRALPRIAADQRGQPGAVATNRGWKRRFDDPILLPRGRQLVTLEDAGKYITKLPKAEHQAAEWLAAMEASWSRRRADRRCLRGLGSCGP
jgi:hypothetical protein